MITALILMHFFGGGTPEIFSRSDFRTVGRTIEEPVRAEAVTQAMERMNELVASTVEKRRETFQKLSEIDVKVDSQEINYDEMLDQLWQARREAGQKYIEEIFLMREYMTRDEWNIAFGVTDE
jgi:hypothetical protein